MLDLITPVLISLFGGVMAVVIFGFYLIRRAGSRPKFETQDYYQTYRAREKYPYGGNPFKRTQVPGERNDQKMLAAIIIGMAVVAMVISALLDNFEILLIIFMLPIIVRFVRARREESKRRTTNDGNRPPY